MNGKVCCTLLNVLHIIECVAHYYSPSGNNVNTDDIEIVQASQSEILFVMFETMSMITAFFSEKGSILPGTATYCVGSDH